VILVVRPNPERSVDFFRPRRMQCGRCVHEWLVDLDWFEEWDTGAESCPGCGLNCEAEDAPRVTVDPTDAALSNINVPLLYWYHSSTASDWPSANYDPAATITERDRIFMGGDEVVERWVAAQLARALHVGTYEAAIHNMLRRINDQGDRGKQFYLYRVRLRPDVVVRDGWLVDPSNFMGDVMLSEVCPAGVDVARYLNVNEDPGGISLALGRSAIASTQRIAVPRLEAANPRWVRERSHRVERAEPDKGSRSPIHARPIGRRQSRPENKEARNSVRALAELLPANLRMEFESVTHHTDGSFDDWARYVSALFDLVRNPGRAIQALNGQREEGLAPVN
jgi:hypothetical protein